MIKTQDSCADPLSENHIFQGNWYRGFESHWKKRYKDINLFRILLSKLIFTNNKFTEEDQVLFFLSYESSLKNLVNRQFQKNYQTDLKICSMLVRNMAGLLSSKTELHQVKRYFRKIYQGTSFCGGRIYLSEKPNFEKYSLVSMKSKEPKKPREPNRIGRGYRDKGNARNSALDGSPSWQEVAQFYGYQDHNCDIGVTVKLEKIYRSLTKYQRNPWENSKISKEFQSKMVGLMVR